MSMTSACYESTPLTVYSMTRVADIYKKKQLLICKKSKAVTLKKIPDLEKKSVSCFFWRENSCQILQPARENRESSHGLSHPVYCLGLFHRPSGAERLVYVVGLYCTVGWSDLAHFCHFFKLAHCCRSGTYSFMYSIKKIRKIGCTRAHRRRAKVF